MSKSDPLKVYFTMALLQSLLLCWYRVFQQHKCNKCIQTLNELALVKYENTSSEMSDDSATSAFYLLPKDFATTNSFSQSLKETPY